MKYVTKLILVMMVIVNLGSESIVRGAGLAGVDIKNLPEWQVQNSSLGGTLLLSDSPEMVSSPGILYQDKVEGKVRLFFYHVNAASKPQRMEVLLENKSREVAHINVTQSSLGRAGYDWMAVGKETLTSYLRGGGAYQITIPPGEVRPLSVSISARAVVPNMLSHGIFDFVTDRAVTVKVLMVPMFVDSVQFSKIARILPPDEWHLRGTFAGANRQLSSVVSYNPASNGVVGLTLADNKVDFYLNGIDGIDGSKVVDYGNYGVVYQILLPSKGDGKIGYYLVPLGGYYAGAIGINHPDITWNPLAIPSGRNYFGSNEEENFSFLGTYDSGDRLSFTFSPPGASNLPVKIVILPQ